MKKGKRCFCKKRYSKDVKKFEALVKELKETIDCKKIDWGVFLQKIKDSIEESLKP